MEVKKHLFAGGERASVLWAVLVSVLMATASLRTADAMDLWDQTVPPGSADTTPAASRTVDGARQRTVAMFYFLWSCESGNTGTRGPTDVSRVLEQYPDAAKQPLHPAWGQSHFGAYGTPEAASSHYHYWGQPLFGYYCSADPWVVARHMQLLTDAGVDLLVMDTTNAVTYDNVVAQVYLALNALTAQGRRAPKVVFYTNGESGNTMQRLYDVFYRDGAPRRNPSTWFLMDGRPLLIGRTKEASAEVRGFFTLRESQWPNEPRVDCGWPWMEFVRPQPVYRCNGRDEVINVSVAQHAETIKMSTLPFEGIDRNWGRGYHDGRRDHSQAAVAAGRNFQEQWDEALTRDPPFVFVTGWNEWIAGRFFDGNQHFMVDLANPEFSRDIEMMAGGWGDAYYLQLIRNVRRYKGVAPTWSASCNDTVNINGSFDQWRRIEAVFRDYVGDTARRDSSGAGGSRLTDNSGRNDIDRMQVACDSDNLYFYVSTADALSPRRGERWMQLFIGVESRAAPGQHEYALNLDPPVSDRYLRLHRRDANSRWIKVDQRIRYRLRQNELHVAVPRELIAAGAGATAVTFKWADNSAADDYLAFYTRGDTAPSGRLRFRLELTRDVK